jgi:hypothetical protein
MTIIKATCPTCGDVQLHRDQVRLQLYPDRTRSYYEFDCHYCNETVRKPAGPEVVRLLRMGGVVAQYDDIPAEALEEHPGPALVPNDVLDALLLLEASDQLAAIAAAYEAPPEVSEAHPGPALVPDDELEFWLLIGPEDADLIGLVTSVPAHGHRHAA